MNNNERQAGTNAQQSTKLGIGAVSSRPSSQYRLMIYFAHSTMVMYAKTIVSHEKMSTGEFMEQNKDVIKRVFDEGLSIMEYELSHHQLERASLVYLQSKYFPSSVYDSINQVEQYPSSHTNGNTMLPAVVVGGSIPAYGINKFINPKKDNKFSPNLYKFLTYGKNKVFTNVFKCKKTGRLYFGLREDNGIWIGTKAMAIFCQGTKAQCFSYATSITEKWEDVTKWFWSKYLEVGKKIYDLPDWQTVSKQ